jgi:hypothetical protein
MRHRNALLRFTAILLGLTWPLGSLGAESHKDNPETVISTFYAKPGAEAGLERVLAQHWATARRMNLMLDTPHVTLRGVDDNKKTYFIDVFTWRDAGIPDAVPPEIKSIWDEMNKLVEARDGHRGIEFKVVSVVTR